MSRRYEQPTPAAVAQVAAAVAAGESTARVSTLLVGAALHDPDWRAVQEICLSLLQEPRAELAPTAATCLGHVARLHGQLDLERVLPVLHQASFDPSLAGRVNDAFDDIRMFINTTPVPPQTGQQ